MTWSLALTIWKKPSGGAVTCCILYANSLHCPCSSIVNSYKINIQPINRQANNRHSSTKQITDNLTGHMHNNVFEFLIHAGPM